MGIHEYKFLVVGTLPPLLSIPFSEPAHVTTSKHFSSTLEKTGRLENTWALQQTCRMAEEKPAAAVIEEDSSDEEKPALSELPELQIQSIAAFEEMEVMQFLLNGKSAAAKGPAKPCSVPPQLAHCQHDHHL